MCINQDIIKRQWHNRNHDVFGKLVRRQIRGAIRRLRDEKPDHVFSSSDEVADRIEMMIKRDDVAAVIVKKGELSFRVMIGRAGYGYCRSLDKNGENVGDCFRVEPDWIFINVIKNYKNVMEVN